MIAEFQKYIILKRKLTIQLSNNKIINCDKLIWTLNHNILLNFFKIKKKKNK